MKMVSSDCIGADRSEPGSRRRPESFDDYADEVLRTIEAAFVIVRRASLKVEKGPKMQLRETI
ncbi:hypothetical protein Acr_02g0004820 [Actinidia rufa]|uniref:Uncharacterized protein n=1 Tax=Actinidia rufa TaxID=165716 RepID=A0A7J0E7G9_9ERIC|nr:hypothetical protein Acr_02g0004820 [Actinidia rufa]